MSAIACDEFLENFRADLSQRFRRQSKCSQVHYKKRSPQSQVDSRRITSSASHFVSEEVRGDLGMLGSHDAHARSVQPHAAEVQEGDRRCEATPQFCALPHHTDSAATAWVAIHVCPLSACAPCMSSRSVGQAICAVLGVWIRLTDPTTRCGGAF